MGKSFLSWCLFWCLFVVSEAGVMDTVESLWQDVLAAEEQKLPKTAIEHLDRLIIIARNSGQKGDFVKAWAKKILNQADILGSKPEEKVALLQKEIAQSDGEVKPMLQLILAIWYWHYYSENRYKFMNRTKTEGMDDEDFTTWDLPKLFNHITQLFSELLQAEALYTSMPLTEFKGLYLPGNLPPSYCETVFEFFVREAISFYSEFFNTLPAPQNAFEIDTNTDVFADLNTFLAFEPEKTTSDLSSPKLQALVLYRRLLNLLLTRSDLEPVIDTDIDRLNFVKEQGVGANTTEIFERRMQEITKRYPQVANSTLAFYELAKISFDQEDFLKSLAYCDEAINRFPDSRGAELCYNLRLRIFEKSFNIKVEHSITEANRTLDIEYRNVKKLYFRVVADQWDRGIDQEWANINEYLSEEEVVELLKKKPVQSWSFDLEPSAEYKQKNVTVPIPKLPFGFYRVFVSEADDFRYDADNQALYGSFWLTNTMLLLRNINDSIQLMVLNATDGRPLPNQTVQIYQREKRGRYRPTQTGKTNSDGIWQLTPSSSDYSSFLFYVMANQTGNVSFHQPQNFYRSSRSGGSQQTVFFTDRAIYRPGQLVQFKGICFSLEHNNRKYQVLENKKVRVHLRDPNYQEISQEVFVTNKYGSFSGQFTLPADGLTGAMQLVADGPSGSAAFRLEEYKRPKFEVVLNAVNQQFRLNDEVEVTGYAKSFSGVSVSDGRVKFRVKREVRLPWWWCWYNPFQGAQEIAHGEMKTDEAGNFSLKFIAKPDLKVDPKTDPSFNYTVSVDVIDTTGETRSSQSSVRIGYSALEATLVLPDWPEADAALPFKVKVQTLDGQPLVNSGKIDIFSLKKPDKPVRKPSEGSHYIYYFPQFGSVDQKTSRQPDLSSYANWEKDQLQQSFTYHTGENGQATVEKSLSPGAYRAVLTTVDMYGHEVQVEQPLLVFSRQQKSFSLPLPSFFQIKNTTVAVGDYLEAVFATGYQNPAIYINFLREGRLLEGSGWQLTGNNFINIMRKIPEKLKGGFTLEVIFVQENQVYVEREFIQVPWTDKQLKLSFASFRDKLRPNVQETWTIKIEGTEAERVAAEMVATLYDASLESFVSHAYTDLSDVFFTDGLAVGFQQNLFYKDLLSYSGYRLQNTKSVRSMEYPFLPSEIRSGFNYFFPVTMFPMRMMKSESMMLRSGSYDAMAAPSLPAAGLAAQEEFEDGVGLGGAANTEEEPFGVELRTNLNETAFFLPSLQSTKDGVVSLSFAMPEALTRWKFLAMAHDQNLRSGLLSAEVITQKELMVEPNLPRFLRQGDQLYFSAKLSNMSEQVQEGYISLSLLDAIEDRVVSAAYSLIDGQQSFQLPPGTSKAFFFSIRVPDTIEPVRYRFMAQAGRFSDGEEGLLPVLSRRILVRESLPLWISRQGEQDFNFTKLLESSQSDSLWHEKLVVQMTSNPAWYAVQALPYLNQFPLECTDQVFNRLYANSLGNLILQKNPKIERVFKTWQGTDALLSNLQKNEDLKAVLLTETPWVLEAKDEEKSKQELAIFFDRNRITNELSAAHKELVKRQDTSGAWSWMPGFKPNFFITNYIAAGFGRLRHLGVPIDINAALKACDYLDQEMRKNYEYIKKHATLEANHYSYNTALYLYGRSFFLGDKEVSASNKEAFDYFVHQAETYWSKLDSRMSEAQTGLALWRLNRQTIPRLILKSLRERSRQDEELGMFWSDTELSYWWYKAPIETQALMIEYFAEMASDTAEVDLLQRWLLKQKQTQHWRTNKATADAVYALLLRGGDLLAEKKPVQVALGGQRIPVEKVETGTGFWEKRFSAAEIQAEMGAIKLTKLDDGIAWGGVYWQYFEDIAKITPHDNNPLNLTKRLYIRELTSTGPVIKPYEKQVLHVGDSLIVRVVLRSDRDMEYVHMKDMRGSGTEPVNVLSTYKYQDGLIYYESTKDTATHFYFDYLPKGTYVFEYELKVFHRGLYESGMVEAQSLYSPEFNAHSESFLLQVQE